MSRMNFIVELCQLCMKLPLILTILIFMSSLNFMLSGAEHENVL